ncbi:MAG: glycosyltransferase [Hyphomicrobium sp.]|jgi:glycosyltransferase involved in cell wall biosynthesis
MYFNNLRLLWWPLGSLAARPAVQVFSLGIIFLMIDISIVLNLHDEWEYLDRTCQSLVEAVSFARFSGISFELVVVLDRASPETLAWCAKYDFERIAPTIFVQMTAGSLAAARQAGLEAASGLYVTTADADDLVSFNYFSAACGVAQEADRRTAVAQEFIFAFGDSQHVWQYFPSKQITKLMPFFMNPYTSRIFARRDFLLELGYRHPDGSRSEAFEDWDINSRILASRGQFQIARDTVLFYRLRSRGIMGGLKGTERLPRYAEYHEPDRFLRVCQIDYERYIAGRSQVAPTSAENRTDVLARRQLVQVIAAANLIDASIRLEQLERAPIGSNMIGNLGWGAAYYEACCRLNGKSFTDVVLLPFLARGGAEKYIINLIAAIREVDPKRSFLILAGQSFDGEHAVDWLPADVTFIDLYSICEEYAPEVLELVTLRLIQSQGEQTVTHLKASPYSESFFQRFKGALTGRRTIYYYFSDPRSLCHGLVLSGGYSFEFVSKHHHDLWLIVSDHRRILRELAARLPISEKCVTIPAWCRYREAGAVKRAKTSFRMLWASRIDDEKRPDLVPQIARELADRGVAFGIDVYGSSTHGDNWPGKRMAGNGVVYKGRYASFDELPTHLYDAFLYTTRYDGLPNVILEAMGSGLPVVAPRIGGIAEAVNGTRGVLIDADCSDAELVGRYADAVVSLSLTDRVILGENAREFVRQSHSIDSLKAIVKQVGI